MASRGRVGHGATLAFSLGGRSRIPGDAPFEGEFTTEFKWTRLRKGVRLRPLGPAHAG